MDIRFANVYMPLEKQVIIALTYIKGIGPALAKRICVEAKVEPTIKIKNLDQGAIKSLRDVIEKGYTVEGELVKQVSLNIKRKKDIKCYQGLRHIRNLPVRGQNTHSNARTRKGKAVPIAGKKKVTK